MIGMFRGGPMPEFVQALCVALIALLVALLILSSVAFTRQTRNPGQPAFRSSLLNKMFSQGRPDARENEDLPKPLRVEPPNFMPPSL
jgi:hypothetical protein